MSSTSSSDEEQSNQKRKSSFIVKKPHFLRRARTLPYELRLLKQRQDDRRRELVKRQNDDINDHISVIEMELSELNEILDEDVGDAIRRELFLKHNISVPGLTLPRIPVLAESAQWNSQPEWEGNNQSITGYGNNDAESGFGSEESCPSNVSSIVADTSRVEKSNESTKTSADIGLVESVEDEDEDEEIVVVQEIKHKKSNNKTAYQRYRETLELWNTRVSKIKQQLQNERYTKKVNTSSWRITNFRTLQCYLTEIKDLLEKPNIMREEEHYAQLQARVTITKLMEVCGIGQFNFLDEKDILTLKRADKELADFQYEWWKSKMNSK